LRIDVGKPPVPDETGQKDPARPKNNKRPARPRKKDYIVSAVKCQRLFISEYRLAFHNRGGSYYLMVKLKSYKRDRWAMGEAEWFNQKAMTMAVSAGGGSYKCFQMWQALMPGQGCVLIKMAFIVPDAADITRIRIGQEIWPIEKVVDSRE